MSQIQIEKTRTDADTRIDNMVALFNCVNKQYVIKTIRLLNEKPMTYSELMDELGVKKENKSGKFSYYLRQIKKTYCIQLDEKTGWYHLTFKGRKVCELLESVEKLANLSIKNMVGVTTSFTLSLDRNRHWIEDLIKTEIQNAVEELKR